MNASEVDPLTEQLAQLAKIMGPESCFPTTRNATSTSSPPFSSSSTTSTTTTHSSLSTAGAGPTATKNETREEAAELTNKQQLPEVGKLEAAERAKGDWATTTTTIAEVQPAPTNTTPIGSHIHEADAGADGPTATAATADATAVAAAVVSDSAGGGGAAALAALIEAEPFADENIAAAVAAHVANGGAFGDSTLVGGDETVTDATALDGNEVRGVSSATRHPAAAESTTTATTTAPTIAVLTAEPSSTPTSSSCSYDAEKPPSEKAKQKPGQTLGASATTVPPRSIPSRLKGDEVMRSPSPLSNEKLPPMRSPEVLNMDKPLQQQQQQPLELPSEEGLPRPTPLGGQGVTDQGGDECSAAGKANAKKNAEARNEANDKAEGEAKAKARFGAKGEATKGEAKSKAVNSEAASPGAVSQAVQLEKSPKKEFGPSYRGVQKQEGATSRTKEREPTYRMEELRWLPQASSLEPRVGARLGARDSGETSACIPDGKHARGIVVVFDLPDLVRGTDETTCPGKKKEEDGVGDKHSRKKQGGVADKNSRRAQLSAGGDGKRDGKGLASDGGGGGIDRDGNRDDNRDGGRGQAKETLGPKDRQEGWSSGSGRRRPTSSDIELDVSRGTLALKVPGVYRLSLALPFPVDADSVIAKFSKLHATLTVSAREQ